MDQMKDEELDYCKGGERRRHGEVRERELKADINLAGFKY